MAVTLGSTGITFATGVTQTTIVPDLGAMIGVTQFSASGTWTNPGASTVIVKLVGGGGGASGYCESGGAGGYCEALINVTGVPSVAVTVGGGGASAAYAGAGGAGGTSSFGAYCSATGGYGANQNYGHSGGYGGVGSGGQVNLLGGTGTGHVNLFGACAINGGGSSYFGGATALIRNHGNLAGHSLGALPGGAPGTGAPGQMTDGYYEAAANTVGKAGVVIVYAYR